MSEKESQQESTPERRRYVRIEDRLLINISQGHTPAAPVQKAFENEAYQFQYLDNQVGMSLSRVRAKNSAMAETLSLLNQKINIAFQASIKQRDDGFYAYEDVSISACGISAPSQLTLNPGDSVWVSLLLPPFNNPISAAGLVAPPETETEATANPTASNTPSALPHKIPRTRIDFVNLNTNQEETLIQYVIRRQNEQLVAARRDRDQQ
jgi:hypothetical protein